MNYPSINKEGLLTALAQIETHPETHDQMTWHCDTAHCVGGWGQILAGKKPNDATAQRDARQFFGLTYYEADRLFAAHNTLDRIREIIEQLTAEGYGSGYDSAGYDRFGLDRFGYDRDGYDCDGFNSAGYDRQGYDSAGFDCDGFDRSGYDRQGYDSDGLDRMNRTREGTQ